MIARIREREISPDVLALVGGDGVESIQSFCADFRGGGDGYSVLLGREEIAPGDLRWHLSVAHTRRLPKWGDLVQIAHELRPGVVFVVGVPPRSWWVNVHEHCMHPWELKDEALVDQWRAERRADAPTSGEPVG